MKTKRLIELLQREDPSGELECCVANEDIHFVSKDPAFWDGRLQVLSRNEHNNYYNITGGKYVASGFKISIHPLSIANAISDDPELSIDYTDCGNPQAAERYKQSDDKTRASIIDMETKMELKLFKEWSVQKTSEISSTTISDSELELFYNSNLSYNDPIDKDIWQEAVLDSKGNSYHRSYNDQRKVQWDRKISFEFDGFGWEISKKL